MEYLIGVILALAISFFATAVGFDRNRAFYPVIVMVVASYYVLFAVMGGSFQALTIECIVVAGFIFVSVLGFKLNLWFVAGALFAHGVFDFFHRPLISNPGVPVWWPGFCMTYDITAAGYLAWLLGRAKVSAQP